MSNVLDVQDALDIQVKMLKSRGFIILKWSVLTHAAMDGWAQKNSSLAATWLNPFQIVYSRCRCDWCASRKKLCLESDRKRHPRHAQRSRALTILANHLRHSCWLLGGCGATVPHKTPCLLYCRTKTKAVFAYISSKQLLPFVFPKQYNTHYTSRFEVIS